MSKEAEFFEAVLAAPDDDAPRLVFADFLTGEGDPRGEFIALQCRLAATPDDEARRKLRIAENKLLAAHEAKWTADFFAVAKSAGWKWGGSIVCGLLAGFVGWQNIERVQNRFKHPPIELELR